MEQAFEKTQIINLIIKIAQENDRIFLPVLFSTSILPEYDTVMGQHDSIASFIEEKKNWLQKWKYVMTT